MQGTGGRGTLAKGERGRLPGQFSLPTSYVALNPARPFFFFLSNAVNHFYFVNLSKFSFNSY